MTLADTEAVDVETARAADIFRSRIEASFALSALILFGSRSRRDHRPDSDADLAVVVRGQPGDRWAVGRALARVAFDVMLETGILIDPLPLWEQELERPSLFTNPALIEKIRRDGRHL